MSKKPKQTSQIRAPKLSTTVINFSEEERLQDYVNDD